MKWGQIYNSKLAATPRVMDVTKRNEGRKSESKKCHTFSLLTTILVVISATIAPAGAQTTSAAVMTSPAPLSTLNSTSATFNWTAGSGVTQYMLFVGTATRGNDIYNQTFTSGTTSATVSGIPTGGAQLFVTLYSLVNGAWQAYDYTFTESGAPNSISLTPANATIRVGQAQPYTAVSGSGGIYALGRASGVASGVYHSCATMTNDTVECWGQNGSGQLGDGTTTNSTTPVTVKGLHGVSALAAGEMFNCALLSNGTVQCWGDNSRGQLGNGTTTSSNTPVAVSGLSGVTSIAAGTFHVCATLANGTAECWGAGDSGQLGQGSTDDASTPVQVSGLSGPVTAISPGEYHTCALLQDTTVSCWGDDEYGQLGDGITLDGPPYISLTPVQVVGLSSVQAISDGPYDGCALLADGTVQCWGTNEFGILGNGTTTDSNVPVAVSGLSSAQAIAVGTYHACAELSDATVKCWGWNGTGGRGYGQLGDGTFTDSSTPVAALYVKGVTSIAASLYNSVALFSDGTVHEWGNNTGGQLGNGGNNPSGYATTVFSGNGGQSVPTNLLGNSGVWTSSNSSTATIDATSGVATGVAKGTTTITASYGTLVASTSLSVSQAPLFTSADSTTFATGTAGSFTVTAVGPPTPTLSESGALPTGVTFNPSTGVLSGTPPDGAAGTYPITFTAVNGNSPNAVQNFTLTVTGTQTAKITSPAPGSTLSGSSVTFNWTPASPATQYLLYVGTTPRAHDVGYMAPSTATSFTVNNVPTNGVNLYVTLFSYLNGAWVAQAYTYTEAGTMVLASMTNPTPGSTLAGSTVTFNWTTGAGPTQYLLYVGTTVRAHDVYYMAPSTATTATATNVPTTGGTLYVTLFSYVNGAWQSQAYTYTESH